MPIRVLFRQYGDALREAIDGDDEVKIEASAFLSTELIQSQVEPLQVDEADLWLLGGAGVEYEDFLPYDTWLYQDTLYGIKGSFTNRQKTLMILEEADKERQKFERLESKFSSEQLQRVKYERERIPESVRVEVWRRDQGKCAQCGSRERLEYDHIVPVSRGGSNTARNVELLCEACNRAKGNRIQ